MWSCCKSGSIRLLALLGLVIPLACQADERKQLAFTAIERNAAEMAAISDSIFYFGEPGMQEFESTKLLKGTLEAAGFRVDLGGAGMPTSIWAEWGSGHPKIAIVTEIDALPSGSQKPLEFENFVETSMFLKHYWLVMNKKPATSRSLKTKSKPFNPKPRVHSRSFDR